MVRLKSILITCFVVASCDMQNSQPLKSEPVDQELANAFMHYTIRYYCENNLIPKTQEHYLQVIQTADQTPKLLTSLEQWLSVVSMKSHEPGKLEVTNSMTGSVARASCDDQRVATS
jgi:hypothetical protein